jgi:DAK2 domain fusion protein YloV
MSDVIPQIDEASRQRLIVRYKTVDGNMLRRLAAAGLTWLRTNQQLVNSLNVFPVPDGDTGTNMVLTMQSAIDEISKEANRSIGQVAHSIAHGALMGARGNSGVILSQIWRGFSRVLDDLEKMDVESMAAALSEARETAYKGVVRPVEGTILTVTKDIANEAEKAVKNGTHSTYELLERIVVAADESVQRTPELLPVLKEAGVVDSGGMGLFLILEGMLRAVYSLPLDQPVTSVQPLSSLNLDNATESIEPGQDWEVIIDFHPEPTLDIQKFYSHLETLGTSIQVGEGDGLMRMHIHVPDKTEYEPIEYVKTLGTITNVAIENLMAQMEEQASKQTMEDIQLEPIQPGDIATVAVAPGNGIARVFASLGVSSIVEGGQTMNPSTQEILNAFENLPTEKVIILPNNKNVVLAAKQVIDLTVKQVAVIPSVSVPQGISALFAFNKEGDFDDVVALMTSALNDVQCLEITTATRSVEIDNVEVQEGQIIALLNGKLAIAGDDIEKVVKEGLALAKAEELELITFYYGADLKAKQANEIAENLKKIYPNQEIEVVEGCQPHYQIIMSIE